MTNKQLLEAMALDLKRIALGSHSGSSKMADRFSAEVIKRKNLLDRSSLPRSLDRLLSKLEHSIQSSDYTRRAEDSLMYSSILLSFAKKI